MYALISAMRHSPYWSTHPTQNWQEDYAKMLHPSPITVNKPPPDWKSLKLPTVCIRGKSKLATHA